MRDRTTRERRAGLQQGQQYDAIGHNREASRKGEDDIFSGINLSCRNDNGKEQQRYQHGRNQFFSEFFGVNFLPPEELPYPGKQGQNNSKPQLEIGVKFNGIRARSTVAGATE